MLETWNLVSTCKSKILVHISNIRVMTSFLGILEAKMYILQTRIGYRNFSTSLVPLKRPFPGCWRLETLQMCSTY